jgi:hypothetical protein
MSRWLVVLLLGIGTSFPAWALPKGSLAEAETAVEEIVDTPPVAPVASPAAQADETAGAQMLAVGLRTDVGFSAGRPTDQGFSLSGLRLNISGEVARYFDYKVSLAPSREFSSVLVPQVLPVDAWVQFRDAGRSSWKSEATFLWKVGMFAPTLNPTFSADLSEVPVPDYAHSHQALLLFRELGSEITWRPVPGVVDLSLGVFNGSGIVSLNTNNAKAFSGSAVVHVGVDSGSTLDLGVSAYSARQSDSGSVNYLANTVGDLFASLHFGEVSVLSLDVASGRLQDSSRSVGVVGVTASAFVGLSPWLRAYFRAEALRYSPSIEPKLNRVQLGPAFDPARAIRLFLYYEHEDDGTGASENAIQALVRLTL